MTSGILLERVVKAITDIENKSLQTIAFNECMQATKTRHPTCVDLVRAVHEAIASDVVETVMQNPDDMAQWGEFQRRLDDYMRHKLTNQEETR